MVKVLIFVESRYRVNRKRIRKTVENILSREGISTPAEISIAIVGDRKMKKLSLKYKGENKARNVLSFSLSEGERIKDVGNVLRLGDIVISYPEVIREAAAQEVLVDSRIDELIIHGLNHLLGIHHE